MTDRTQAFIDGVARMLVSPPDRERFAAAMGLSLDEFDRRLHEALQPTSVRFGDLGVPATIDEVWAKRGDVGTEAP